MKLLSMLKTSLKVTIFLLAFFFIFFKNVPSCFSFECNSDDDLFQICNNGPSSGNSNGCGEACGSGDAWSKYQCQKELEHGGLGGSYYYFLYRVGNVCSTGDKCISGEKGLRPGYCDCGSSGPLYKTCCRGSTAVECVDYGVQDPYSPPEGTCPSGSTIVYGTSCPSGGGSTICGDIGGTYCNHNDSSCPSGTSPLGATSDCIMCCGPSGSTETHRVCSGTSCVTVAGAGSNACSSDTDCGGGATHKVCSGTSCVTVSGAGSNACNSDSDCGGGGGGGGSCAVISAYNGACPVGYVNSGGCCVCP